MEKKQIKKIGIGAGLILGLTFLVGALVLTSNIVSVVERPSPSEVDDSTEWREFAVITDLTRHGDFNPGAGASGFLSIFLLDYAQNPAAVLAENGTDWSTSAVVHAYADADSFSEDCPANDPFYFVVRARFNRTHCYDVNKFIDARCRVKLTVSGDETITTVAGTAVVSDNSSAKSYIWINFYWDDAVDGYRILLDGTLTVSEIKIEAKY